MSEIMTALELAILFHVVYERKAAEFNYVTRTDTRIFDPESSNGKLMIATCEEILSEDIRPKLDALTAENAKLRELLGEVWKAVDYLDIHHSYRELLSRIQSALREE